MSQSQPPPTGDKEGNNNNETFFNPSSSSSAGATGDMRTVGHKAGRNGQEGQDQQSHDAQAALTDPSHDTAHEGPSEVTGQGGGFAQGQGGGRKCR